MPAARLGLGYDLAGIRRFLEVLGAPFTKEMFFTARQFDAAEARHLREIVLPLRKQIVDQTLLHYNAMDADPFELIVARRQLVEAGQQYLDALRRYWNAIAEITALRRGVLLAPVEIAAPRSGAVATPDNH